MNQRHQWGGLSKTVCTRCGLERAKLTRPVYRGGSFRGCIRVVWVFQVAGGDWRERSVPPYCVLRGARNSAVPDNVVPFPGPR